MPGMEAVAAGAGWIPHRGRDAGRATRAVGAAILAALAMLPGWKLLAGPETGLAGTATVEMAATYTSFVWSGLVLLLIPAILLSRVVSAPKLESAARLASRVVRVLPGPVYVLLI
jgi:hypothetical protein